MMEVKKAVIPAAGMGTRFLPVTKASPKEMLPLVDKPLIQEVVEEAVRSGLREVILITGRGKRAIEDHFDDSCELEDALAARGQTELLERIRAISRLADFAYIRQKEPKGLGHAILTARFAVGDAPFAVLLGDDIIDGEDPCVAQLIRVHAKVQRAVVALMEVPEAEVHRYGIIEGEDLGGGLYRVKRLVEKPRREDAPSRLAVIGRYILPPSIFPAIEALKPGFGREYQLTDALDTLARTEGVYGFIFNGVRHDAGDRFGFLKANIHYALKDPELGPMLRAHLLALTAREPR
jgi:UTP--glucose-1-phosphate uridylyltransferase